MSSSVDWEIACENITDNATFYETVKLFEDSINETIGTNLTSNQVLREISTTEMCGTTTAGSNSIFRRRLAMSSVHFTMELEEQNSSDAQGLFDKINGDLALAVNSGQLTTTLQTKGKAANLTALGNANIQANSTTSNYVVVTSEPTAFPTSQPTKKPTNFPTSQPTNIPSKHPTQPPSKPQSNPPTTVQRKWYMKYDRMKCYQDCTGDYPCGGKKKFWMQGYATALMVSAAMCTFHSIMH
jgi:hypothetical protein